MADPCIMADEISEMRRDAHAAALQARGIEVVLRASDEKLAELHREIVALRESIMGRTGIVATIAEHGVKLWLLVGVMSAIGVAVIGIAAKMITK